MRLPDRPLTNDHVAPEEFDRLLRAWFGNAARVLLAPTRTLGYDLVRTQAGELSADDPASALGRSIPL
jgi:hypothetical protein